MNILAWVLATSTLFLVMIKAVAFQKAAACRQNAWLHSTVLKTRLLLVTKSTPIYDAQCGILVTQSHTTVSWRRLSDFKKHDFHLTLKGKL